MGACLLPFIGFMPGCYLIKVGRTAVDDDVTDGIKADGGERDPLPSIGVVPALFCLLSIARVGCKIKRLSQNRVGMASFVLFQIEVIWIFLKKGVYKLTFEGFILSNCFFRCHKPPKRLLLQDYVQWPAGRTQFQPS